VEVAAAVVLGALTWGVVLRIALEFGAHIFSHPNWQVATEAITAGSLLGSCSIFHERDYRITDRKADS
jgi:hypothetical protein